MSIEYLQWSLYFILQVRIFTIHINNSRKQFEQFTFRLQWSGLLEVPLMVGRKQLHQVLKRWCFRNLQLLHQVCDTYCLQNFLFPQSWNPPMPFCNQQHFWNYPREVQPCPILQTVISSDISWFLWQTNWSLNEKWKWLSTWKNDKVKIWGSLKMVYENIHYSCCTKMFYTGICPRAWWL